MLNRHTGSQHGKNKKNAPVPLSNIGQYANYLLHHDSHKSYKMTIYGHPY